MITGRVAALGALALAVMMGGTAVAGGTPNQKCAASKIKLAGKKAACLLGLDSKAESSAGTADPAKVLGCKSKMSAAYAKADIKGCAKTGDGATIETKVDNFEADINSDLALCGDAAGSLCRKCQGGKIKLSGKKAACLTGLRAKEAAGGVLDPLKVKGCKDKFSSAFAKLELKGGCATTADSGAEETKIDMFVDDVVSEIPSSCPAIVTSQPIPNTYQLNGTTGELRCTTNAASNRFGTCTSDANCGGTPGSCLQLPWVTADGQVMSFPTGTQTTFTVTEEGSNCEHELCIPCGNPNASCAGVPGCEVAGNPNGCVPRGTQGCCDQPGFVVPTFFVNILGGLCSRVDQIDCGIGVVNTSNPQTGDNDVKKEADTSDPGPDCIYGTGDDPAPLLCNTTGAGNDYKGKIQRTIGNGSIDANGIHFRLTTPELSTSWQDSQSPAGTCANGSTYDDGELLISQIIIKAEPTSAGASGAFVDLNGDGCKRAGNGFITSSNPSTDGPISVPGAPAGPARPQSYNGTTGAVTATVSAVFSGPNSPIKDIGFVAITPNLPAQVVTARQCSCNVAPGCPE